MGVVYSPKNCSGNVGNSSLYEGRRLQEGNRYPSDITLPSSFKQNYLQV